MIYHQYEKWVKQAIWYIEQNLKEEIRPEDVASYISMSTAHFHRIFQSIVGVSIAEYIRQRRLSDAGVEIVHTNKRMIEIAVDYQFGTQESFTRAFKKLFGLPPKQYKRYYSAILAKSEGLSMDTILPTGWIQSGSHSHEYEIRVDSAVMHQGKPSARIVANPEVTRNGFGTLLQMFKATHYQNKRLRLSAFIRTDQVEDLASLWMRIDGKDGQILGFDNMNHRPIQGTTDWNLYSIVLDVPSESEIIAFGFILSGPGTVWVNGIRLEEVECHIPTTNLIIDEYPDHPVNLEFSMEG